MKNDTINRQAAIDVLEERIQANGYSNVALVSELNRSIEYLIRLPSVQSEITYCKDCRFFVDHRCRYWRALDDWRGANDYCSKAEREGAAV